MKRILIISPMPPLIGGVAISSGRLFDNLKADGYDVDSYNIRPNSRIFNSSVGVILRYLWIPFYILFHKKYDIVHCHVSGTYRKMYIAMVRPFCFKGAKLIHTLHGDVNPLLNKRAINAMSKADKLICVQKGDSALLPESLKLKSVDIPAFIMPKLVTEESVPTNILDFVKNRKYPMVLFYGGVIFNNQFDDLYGVNDAIDLYMYMKSKRVNIQMLLLITYKDNDENISFMKKIKEKIKGEPNILLVENKNVQMLPLFRYADLYIRPTKTDGDSLAVREALCMQCHVVASDRAIRPLGTVIYSNQEEFFRLSEICISEKPEIIEQENFYNQIKNVYEAC